jgi:hypothetical protein
VEEHAFDDLDIQHNETDTENPKLDYEPNELQSDILQKLEKDQGKILKDLNCSPKCQTMNITA